LQTGFYVRMLIITCGVNQSKMNAYRTLNNNIVLLVDLADWLNNFLKALILVQ
jgi:hypothetical protein